MIPAAPLSFLGVKFGCLPIELTCHRVQRRACMFVRQTRCQFPRMGRFIPQFFGFAHNTVLVTGGSVRSLSSGGRRISQPLVPGACRYQR